MTRTTIGASALALLLSFCVPSLAQASEMGHGGHHKGGRGHGGKRHGGKKGKKHGRKHGHRGGRGSRGRGR